MTFSETFCQITLKVIVLQNAGVLFQRECCFSLFFFFPSLSRIPSWGVNHGVCQSSVCFMDACELNVISSGYIFALGPLLFVSIFDVWLEQFTTKQAYVINLVSVGVVAFGCTGIISLPAYFRNLPLCSYVDCCAMTVEAGVFFFFFLHWLWLSLHVLHASFLSQCSSRVSMATWGCFRRDIRKAL